MYGEVQEFQRAKAIFSEAEELVDRDRRVAYLDQACQGDLALRAEVERLLAAAAEAGDFLAKPAVGPVPADGRDQPLAEGPGAVIGPYQLREQIGEGGFGLVFVAEQRHPVRRQVALKIIKPGMDTRQVIARFEAERQVLALMDHPHIAKVLDAGSTDSGRPYFAMELVRGVPLTQYCDAHSLTVRERLELFVALCRAIQHAHQKGIIHRDLKPTNVLVTQQDDQPTPKVIDFGVAKALSQRLTERTLSTQFVQMIGTPLYMSPEQADLNGLDVDTRSDIYSLGVVLYELLTGTTPFDGQRLQQAAVDEVCRIVREEDPPTPSTRLSRSGEQLATTAAQRRMEAGRLVKHVRGELDWIVMKCLEKDRNRRYETAAALALDVQRYLADEPVHACPPSAMYRFGKFARRNKGKLSATCFVIAALLAGSTIAVGQAIRARHAERIALAHSAQAASEAATATAISDLLLEMLESANPDAARGTEFTVRQMLDQFSEGLSDQLQDHPEAEATIRLTIGNAYRRLLLLDQAERHIETALAQRRHIFGPDHVLVADALVTQSWLVFERGDYAGAEALARNALAICRQVDAAPAKTLKALDVLSLAIWKLDGYDDARLVPVAQQIFDIAEQSPDDCPEAANVLHRLAACARERGDLAEAEDLARQSVALHRRLQGEHHPETAWGLVELGRALSDQHQLTEAKDCFLEAAAIFSRCFRDSHKLTVQTYVRLAEVLRALGDDTGLSELRDTALRLDAADDPDWECWQNRARLHEALDQWNEAAACLRRAVDVAPPAQAADLYLELGQALSDQGKLDEAKACFYDALDLYRQFHRDSETPVLATYFNLGRTAWCQGDAIGVKELGAQISALALVDDPDCESWALRGTMLVNMGLWEESTACFRKAIALAPPARAVELHLELAVALMGQGREQEADDAMRKAIAAKPDEEALALNWMAWRLVLTGETAIPGVRRAVALAERAVKLAPGEKEYWTTLGIAHYRGGAWQSAIDAFTKAVDISHGGDAQDWLFLAMAHWKHGEKSAARVWYDRAAAWLDQQEVYRPEWRRYRRDAAELLGIETPQSTTDASYGERDDSDLFE